jgi:hypothetical protein
VKGERLGNSSNGQKEPSNGGGNAVGAGMRDFTLVNSQGFCNGGCKGASAIGGSTGIHGVRTTRW